MAELTTLHEAVAGLVHDGDTVALEGFTHAQAGLQLRRQPRRRLAAPVPRRRRERLATPSVPTVGNVQPWGILGVQKEAALAADRVLVTVGEVVDELDPRPGAGVLPGWVVSAVAVDTFVSWMTEHVLDPARELVAR